MSEFIDDLCVKENIANVMSSNVFFGIKNTYNPVIDVLGIDIEEDTLVRTILLFDLGYRLNCGDTNYKHLSVKDKIGKTITL